MAYNPKTWKDDKVGQTPIKAEDLNHIEQGIANAVEKNTDALLTNVVSRNLLGMNNYSYVIWNLNSGATVTAGKENLKITTSGKAYSGIFGKLCQFANLVENKTYTVSFDAKASANINLQYGITSNSKQIAITSQTKRISLQETGKNLKNTNFQFYCLSTVVCTITIENIMINEGNDATPYAPYLNLQELQDNSFINNYLTDEQKIGKWIDGKPLYRKVIKTTMAETPSNGTYVSKDVDIGTHIDFGFVEKTILIYGTQHMSLPYINNAGYSTKCFINSNSNLILANGNSTFNNCKTYVILEYTKTTD